MQQWENEIKLALKPKSFDVLLYYGGKAAISFWAPDGPYHKSLHSPSQRIILASHSVSPVTFLLILKLTMIFRPSLMISAPTTPQ